VAAYSAPFVVVSWSPTNSFLQQAPSPSGPWETLTNLTNPYGFVPDAGVSKMFYRVTLPLNDVICRP
jgi:hypothetical protein